MNLEALLLAVLFLPVLYLLISQIIRKTKLLRIEKEDGRKERYYLLLMSGILAGSTVYLVTTVILVFAESTGANTQSTYMMALMYARVINAIAEIVVCIPLTIAYFRTSIEEFIVARKAKHKELER